MRPRVAKAFLERQSFSFVNLLRRRINSAEALAPRLRQVYGGTSPGMSRVLGKHNAEPIRQRSAELMPKPGGELANTFKINYT